MAKVFNASGPNGDIPPMIESSASCSKPKPGYVSTSAKSQPKRSTLSVEDRLGYAYEALYSPSTPFPASRSQAERIQIQAEYRARQTALRGLVELWRLEANRSDRFFEITLLTCADELEEVINAKD